MANIASLLKEEITRQARKEIRSSTVGLDEEMVRAYIRNQEQEDERYDPMRLGV